MGDVVSMKAPVSTRVDNILDFRDALEALRHEVENPNRLPKITLVNGLYRQLQMAEVKTVTYPPWVIGYQVQPVTVCDGFFERRLYVKCPGEKLIDIPDENIEPILIVCFDELLEANQDMPEPVEIAYDAIMFVQIFQVSFLVQQNSLVVPGKKG